jgi:hypothetical protein
MSFCWENGYHGVLSDEGEFALYNPPKYFSAHDLKLSYQVRGHSRWGGRGSKNVCICPRLGYKNCPHREESRGGGGVKNWQISVHVVVEWPNTGYFCIRLCIDSSSINPKYDEILSGDLPELVSNLYRGSSIISHFFISFLNSPEKNTYLIIVNLHYFDIYL